MNRRSFLMGSTAAVVVAPAIVEPIIADGISADTLSVGMMPWKDIVLPPMPPLMYVVDELPIEGDTDQLLFLTTNSRLYRWSGVDWHEAYFGTFRFKDDE